MSPLIDPREQKSRRERRTETTRTLGAFSGTNGSNPASSSAESAANRFRHQWMPTASMNRRLRTGVAAATRSLPLPPVVSPCKPASPWWVSSRSHLCSVPNPSPNTVTPYLSCPLGCKCSHPFSLQGFHHRLGAEDLLVDGRNADHPGLCRGRLLRKKCTTCSGRDRPLR